MVMPLQIAIDGPVGAPLPELAALTVAVNWTLWPNTAGLTEGLMVVVVIVGAGLLTTCPPARVPLLLLYVAPAFIGGDRGRRAFAGDGAPTMAELTRGRFVAIDRLGDDLRIVVVVER